MKRSPPKSSAEQTPLIRQHSVHRRGVTNSLFLISCLVAVVAPPALHAILSSSDVTRQAMLQKASQLSAIDRERVERNFARFQKMDDATRRHFVEMNQQIGQQPELQETLETYCSWVTTLTPGQRQDLLESTDRARKILLTQEFHKDQQQRDSRRVGPPPLDNISSLRRLSPVRLSAADIKNVVERIRQKHNLPSLTSSNEPVALSNAKTVLEFVKRTGNFQLLASRPDLTQGLVDLVSGPRQLTDRLRDLSDRHVVQCQLLWHAIFSTLFADMLDEIERRKPSEAVLQQIFETLSGEEQERLYRSSGKEVRNWLTRRYFADASDPITQELGKTLDELDDRRASFLPAPVELFKGFRPPGMDGPGRRPEGGNPNGGRGRPMPPNDQNRPFRPSSGVDF